MYDVLLRDGSQVSLRILDKRERLICLIQKESIKRFAPSP
jgi:hypothetical protein